MRHPRRTSRSLDLARATGQRGRFCVAYLGQFFVPVGLSIFYSYPEAGWPAWQVAAAAALVAGDHGGGDRLAATYPYLLRRLVLVSRNAGPGARVDRRGRPCPGRPLHLSAANRASIWPLVWGAMRLAAAAWPARRWVFGVGSAAMLVALMACTWRQTGYWQDAQTLWEHALACDPTNPTARYNLGLALEQTDPDAARAEFRRTLDMGPDQRRIYVMVRRQNVLRVGQAGRATRRDRRGANQLRGGPSGLWRLRSGPHGLGLARGQTRENGRGARGNAAGEQVAAGECRYRQQHGPRAGGKRPDRRGDRQLPARDPLDANSQFAQENLGTLLAKQGRTDEAIVHLRRAIRIMPDVAAPYYALARLLARARQYERGRPH